VKERVQTGGRIAITVGNAREANEMKGRIFARRQAESEAPTRETNIISLECQLRAATECRW